MTQEKKRRIEQDQSTHQWEEFKVIQLREICKGHDLSMSGTKKQLIERLRRHAEGKEPTKTQIERMIQFARGYAFFMKN